MVAISNRRSSYSFQRNALILVVSTTLMSILLYLVMGIRASSVLTNKNMSTQSTTANPTNVAMESRLRAAMWSYFAGDALSSPTHWYYGGFPQIKRDYGKIVDYTKPVHNLHGSILNKSNLNGGGRSSQGGSNDQVRTIIGDIINHGKKDLWNPTKQIHYHATLQAGENTLEVTLARVLMKSIVTTGGVFDADHFRKAYVEFMMRPGSHNDTYASTCHRMFFENLVFNNLTPEKCPSDDGHNVETIDGLVLPTIVSLASSARGSGVDQVAEEAANCADVTRRSNALLRASRVWSRLVHSSLHRTDISGSLEEAARAMGFRKPRGNKPDEITACYLDSSMPALFDSIAKYSGTSPWKALLANANTGGENVHRGSCLGAVLGANVGLDSIEPRLIEGLYDHEKLAEEIDDFVQAVLPQR